MALRSRQKTIRVAGALRGCTTGTLQGGGYMQVIPLVSELSDDRFVSPVDGEAEVFTAGYGSLGFRNPRGSEGNAPQAAWRKLGESYAGAGREGCYGGGAKH